MASTHTMTGIIHQPRGQMTVAYLPLEEVKVKAWVVDVSSRIVLTQTFHNLSDEPTGRAKYIFPLPANAAVCAFDLELEDGTVIVGEVKEKEEAAHTFTRAVDQGTVAALVETVTDDIFTISVGSIPASTRVIANLTFVMDLLDEALRDHVRLQLPMHIAERYGTQPAAMNDASSADSRTRVRISVDVQTSDVIHSIRSPTHHVSIRRYKGHSDRLSRRRMSAVWKSSEFLKKDFIIAIHANRLDMPRCFAEVLPETGSRDGSTVAMQLTLVSNFLTPKMPSQEYIFIIDRSGSMQNGSIETAKQTLIILLRLLPTTRTTFNIFSFGSTVEYLWKRSRDLNSVALVEAIKHVGSMSANLGGTETPRALHSALNSRGLDRPSAIFLLTDGDIHSGQGLDPFSVISDAIHKSPTHAPVRLFVLGIGTNVSSDICSKLARHGNGEYLFAHSAVDILDKCARLVNAGRSKNIESISVDWGYDSSDFATVSPSPTPTSLPTGVPALGPPPPLQQAPHSLTKIFSGFRFTVFAIMSSKTVPRSVKLIVKQDGVAELQELVVDVAKVKPFSDISEYSVVPIVHTLAARKLIMELDDGVGPLPIPAADDALLASEDDLRRAGIIRLGLTYQLISKHTSFVAVQEGSERRRNKGGRGPGSGTGSNAWARSRLRQTSLSVQADSENDTGPAEAPTFFDGLIDGVASFITSVFGLLSNPATLTSATTTRPTFGLNSHRQGIPGAFDDDDSGSGAIKSTGRGRRPQRNTSSSPRRRSVSSHNSTATFSSLSSLDSSSSCSTCWTSSRPPSPPPRFREPIIDRTPSPDFHVLGVGNTGPDAPQLGLGVRPMPSHGGSGSKPRHHPITQEVYDLFQQMDVDGSIKATAMPFLTQLVGEAVLRKAQELQIDERVWATIVVVAYMRAQLEGEPDLVDLVSEKAKEYVEASEWASQLGGGVMGFEEMVRKAAESLNGNDSTVSP